MLLVAATILKYIFVSVYSLPKLTLSQVEPDFTLKIFHSFPFWVFLVLTTFPPRSFNSRQYAWKSLARAHWQQWQNHTFQILPFAPFILLLEVDQYGKRVQIVNISAPKKKKKKGGNVFRIFLILLWLLCTYKAQNYSLSYFSCLYSSLWTEETFTHTSNWDYRQNFCRRLQRNDIKRCNLIWRGVDFGISVPRSTNNRAPRVFPDDGHDVAVRPVCPHLCVSLQSTCQIMLESWIILHFEGHLSHSEISRFTTVTLLVSEWLRWPSTSICKIAVRQMNLFMIIFPAPISKIWLSRDLIHDICSLHSMFMQVIKAMKINVPVRLQVNNMAPFSLSALCVFPFQPLCHLQCPLSQPQSEQWRANEQ